MHLPNAHTDGDTYSWFRTATVLATGDTFTNGRYPNIDFANGGNIKGMIAAADAYLKLVNAKTRIVPGHGPVADKAALADYRAMLVTAAAQTVASAGVAPRRRAMYEPMQVSPRPLRPRSGSG